MMLVSGTLKEFLKLNLTVISSSEPDNNSKSLLSILILDNTLLVSALILLDIKSTWPMKTLFL